MDVDPGYEFIEKIRGGVQWYMMQSKDFVSSNSFKLKNEKAGLVSFIGQSPTFRLSIREVDFFLKDKDFYKKKRLFPKKNKIKNKSEMNNTKSTLPPNRQTSKRNLLSGNGLIVYNLTMKNLNYQITSQLTILS